MDQAVVVMQRIGNMIIHDILNRSQRALFILLKAGIWNRIPEKDFFLNFSETDWKEVYRLAVKQGVMSLAYDAVMRLPEDLRPPRSLKLNWALNVEAQEKRYAKQETVAIELAEILSKGNIQMFLFKGLSLAQYYPIPSHREFGDLDIYLLGKYNEGSELLLKQGLIKKHDDPKHTSLLYKGISIENHVSFLSLHRHPHLKNLDRKMIELSELQSDKTFPNNILFPAPEFNALHIMSHAILHFPTSIVLRHLCDWAVFLEANNGKIDFVNYKKALSEAGLLKAADAFTALAVRFLELNPEVAPVFNSDSLLEDRILLDILNPLVLQKKNPSPLDIISIKYRILKSRRWKFELIKHNGYCKFIIYSIFLHIRYPELILRLKQTEK